MQGVALSFQSGVTPTARTSVTTTVRFTPSCPLDRILILRSDAFVRTGVQLSGSFNIYGLIEMCKIGSNASGTYETPSIDRGRWQVKHPLFPAPARIVVVVLIQSYRL